MCPIRISAKWIGQCIGQALLRGLLRGPFSPDYSSGRLPPPKIGCLGNGGESRCLGWQMTPRAQTQVLRDAHIWPTFYALDQHKAELLNDQPVSQTPAPNVGGST
jgi:hypothetical protein